MKQYRITKAKCGIVGDATRSGIPKLFSSIDIPTGDNWDENIMCVLVGMKKVAITDYNSFSVKGQQSLVEYYGTIPMDRELREYALNHGVRIMYDNTGTAFWFYEEHQKYAELLIFMFDNFRLFLHNYEPLIEPIRSILLGYNQNAYLLFRVREIVHDQVQDMLMELKPLEDLLRDMDQKQLNDVYHQVLKNNHKLIISNYNKAQKFVNKYAGHLKQLQKDLSHW